MVEVEVSFIAAGCTRRPHVLASSSLRPSVLFASASDLVVLDLGSKSDEPRIVRTVAAHRKEVTCLKRASSSLTDREYEVYTSGSADGGVVVWHFNKEGELASHAITGDAHSCAVNFATSFERAADVVTVSCGNDRALVRWWPAEKRHEELSQTISRSQDIALSADFAQLDNGTLVLALGTSKRFIEVYYEDKEFILGVTLNAHGDWVDALAFNCPIMTPSEPLLLASASHDRHVKLWRFSSTTDEIDPDELVVTRLHFTTPDAKRVAVNLEAVLAGHEDWVQSVEWERKASGERSLVTASADKAVLVWHEVPDETTGTSFWTEKVRLGMVSGYAVGFYAGVWVEDSKTLVANSYFGGLHMWRSEDENGLLWNAHWIPAGHFAAVRDLDWEPRGRYLLSCSADQTTRTYVPRGDTFVELARPQVHGHDMQCIAAINAFVLKKFQEPCFRATFVSGAEEKISRAFIAPKTFAASLANISGVNADEMFAGFNLADYGATLPALGLSNKGTGVDEEGEAGGSTDYGDEGDVIRSVPQVFTEPPTEDCLQQNTLWPEVHKLYGHGFELFALAANSRGTLIASACRASHVEHAEILIWSTKDWSCGGRAKNGHQLTVTQVAFSPDSRFLLSVSRDRTLIVYAEASGNEDGFDWNRVWAPSTKAENPHARIIWTADWFEDSRHFVTGSRDQKLAVWNWSPEDSRASVLAVYTAPASVNAVATKTLDSKRTLIAAGLEDGRIQLLIFQDGQVTLVKELDRNLAHSDTIQRLRTTAGFNSLQPVPITKSRSSR